MIIAPSIFFGEMTFPLCMIQGWAYAMNTHNQNIKIHLTKIGTEVERRSPNVIMSMKRLKADKNKNKNIQILQSVQEMGNWLMRACTVGISAGSNPTTELGNPLY